VLQEKDNPPFGASHGDDDSMSSIMRSRPNVVLSPPGTNPVALFVFSCFIVFSCAECVLTLPDSPHDDSNEIVEKKVVVGKNSDEGLNEKTTPKRPRIVRQGTMGGDQNIRLPVQHNGHLAGALLPKTEDGGDEDVGSDDDDDSIEMGEKKSVGKNGDEGMNEEATPKRPNIVRQGTMGGDQNTRLSFQHNGHLVGDLLPMTEAGGDDGVDSGKDKHSDLSKSYGNRRTSITSWLATPSSDICLQQTRGVLARDKIPM
jgi:hypothetical protein